MYAIYAYIGVVWRVNVGIYWHTWSVWGTFLDSQSLGVFVGQQSFYFNLGRVAIQDGCLQIG